MKRFSFFFNVMLSVVVIALLFHRAQSQEEGTVPVEAVSAPSSLLFSYQGQLLDAGGNPVTDPAVPMTFSLYNTATGGTACWTEERDGNNAVAVENGRFSLLLGQITAIPKNCLTADAYLELTVNGETLSPRERLTSVSYAVEAGTITANAATSGSLYINGKIFTTAGAELGLQNNGGGRLILTNNPGDNKIFLEGFSSDMTGSASELLITGWLDTPLPLFTLRANQTNISGNLNVGGSCTASIEGNEIATVNNCTGGSITSGAYIEANFPLGGQFSEGALLCWGENALVLCDIANTSLVQAVADENGRPIVLGAELIQVIGPVHKGDYLVASNIPGYAMAAKTPTFGIVIAQALEDFDGNQGLILAMIRKM